MNETVHPWRRELPVLHGARVYLREVMGSDAAGLFELITQDEDVQRHISAPPPSIVAFHGFIRWCQDQRARGESVCFAIVPHGLTHAVGIVQIRKLGLDFCVAEWGFAIGSMFWSTGVFMEAAVLAADFAFSTLKTFRLEGRAATANGRGNGVLLKLGASSEALLRRGLKRDDVPRDQFIWGLLAEEWRDRPAECARRFSAATAQKGIDAAIAAFQARLLNQPQPDQPSQSSAPAPHYPFFVGSPPPKSPDVRGESEPPPDDDDE
jgi:ribosomal-protein-alanine N-acetyltransferase